jgi:hypothetical protein
MPSRRLVFFLAFLAIPLLGGGQCSFFYSSGGNDKDEQEADAGLVVIVGDGVLVDAPVAGVGYESGTLAGITGDNGEFRYEVGNTIRFSIGDIPLGQPVMGKAVITPLDLVANGTADTPAVINIARLLQSLDSNPRDGVITIPATVRVAAVRSNGALSSTIEYLDFSDEATFVNTASQLVAVLTSGYPFTAVLVDADQARTHMTRSLDKLGLKPDIP